MCAPIKALVGNANRRTALCCLVEADLSSHALFLCFQAQAQMQPDRPVVFRAGKTVVNLPTTQGGKHMNRTSNVLKKPFIRGIFIGMLAILLLRTGGTTPLALALTCGQWNVIPSPNGPPPGSDLTAVEVVSPNDVWAVGYNLPAGSTTTLIEHWDGTQWSVIPGPNLHRVSLNGVAAVSSNDVWAVGDYGRLTTKPLVEHWDGTQWSVVKSPVPHGYSRLNGVAASGKGTLWAVGYYTNRSGYVQTLIERGQGNTWSIVPSPNPGGGDDFLGGVSSVPGSHTLWAVGWTDTQTLIERWNGSTWKAVSSPSPGSRLAPLIMCGPSEPITQAVNPVRRSPSTIVSCGSLLKYREDMYLERRGLPVKPV